MTDAGVQELGYTPVYRDLPAHDVPVYFVTLRDDSRTWGIARRRGVRWYYADVPNGLEMPDPPTHWKPYP